MRCCRGKAIELRKVLLAGQRQFGRRQRSRQLTRLFRDLPSVDANVANRQQDREPDADHISFRQLEWLFAFPRQLIMHENQDGRAEDGKNAEQQSHARRQINTGPTNKNEKGFSTPPVRNRSAVNSARSKPNR